MDQAETVLMRRQGGSGPAGLAGMPALAEQSGLRLVRPLLGVAPGRLRETLHAAGVAWVEDPSNHDWRALRPRLRANLDDPAGSGPVVAALRADARTAGVARARREFESAAALAEKVAFRPEGFAVVAPGPMAPAALAAVIQAVSGAGFPPPTQPVATLAARPRAATLAGVQLLGAGRLGSGWLVVREAAAMEPQRLARPGTVWDGRFRLMACADPPPNATLGALGADAVHFRRRSDLPSAVLQTLPALRQGKSLVAVPHLLYPNATACAAVQLVFSPRRPAAGAPFLPDSTGERVTGDAGRERTPHVIL
jgi:tRNA(Ile)-lysidine synthase